MLPNGDSIRRQKVRRCHQRCPERLVTLQLRSPDASGKSLWSPWDPPTAISFAPLYRSFQKRHTPSRLLLAPDETRTPPDPGFSRWRPLRGAGAKRGLQVFHPAQVAPTTVWAQGRILARQPCQSRLPSLTLRRDGRRGFGRRLGAEELTALHQVDWAMAIGQQPVVADAHEAGRPRAW